MGIDGVGGPKGPGGKPPVESQPVSPTGSVKSPTTQDVLEVGDVADGPAAEEVGPISDAGIAEAIEEVATELRSGKIKGPGQALSLVIERIVETRYSSMNKGQRRRFVVHVRELLANDPVIGARIQQLLK